MRETRMQFSTKVSAEDAQRWVIVFSELTVGV